MAVKDIKDYYYKICKQRADMLDSLKEIETSFSNGMATPEQVDNIRKITEPINTTYKMLSWIIYLLDKPNRKNKENGYIRRSKKFLDSLDIEYSKEKLLEKNQACIENLNEAKLN